MWIRIPQGRVHHGPRAGRDHVRGKDRHLMAGQDHHVADLAHGQDQDVATVAEQNQGEKSLFTIFLNIVEIPVRIIIFCQFVTFYNCNYNRCLLNELK